MSGAKIEIQGVTESFLVDYSLYYVARKATNDAATNLARLQADLAAAKLVEKPLFLPPGQTYNINAAWSISGNNVEIVCGSGTSIVQETSTEHGIVLDTTSPPQYLTFRNLTLEGTGATTSTKAGIYGRKGDNSYLCGDIDLWNCRISDFDKGVELRNVVKFFTHRMDVVDNRIGIEQDKVDTYLHENIRIVGTTGADITNSACFVMKGGNFGGCIKVGEFGGKRIARFAEVSEASKINLEGCNGEGFTSSQVITCDNSQNYIRMANCRVLPKVGAAATDSVISINGGGTTVATTIDLTNVSDFSPLRAVEVYNGTSSPVSRGAEVKVTRTATQGGAVVDEYYLQQDRRVYSGALPVSSNERGQLFVKAATGAGTDTWLDNLIAEVKDTKTGQSRHVSLLNDMLCQVLDVGTTVNSDAGTETTVFTATIPANYLSSNGESVHIKMHGGTAANANNKRWRMKINGATVFDTGVLTPNGEKWRFNADLQRGSGGINWDVCMLSNGVGIGTLIDYNTSLASPTADITITLTVEATAASDIVTREKKAIWFRDKSDITFTT